MTTIRTSAPGRCLCGHPAEGHEEGRERVCATGCGCGGYRSEAVTPDVWSALPSSMNLEVYWLRTYAGAMRVGGEATGDPSLRIIAGIHPDVDEVRYTGGHDILHVPSGYVVHMLYGPPPVWLRRFARLLADSPIAWEHVRGDTSHVLHPLHTTIEALGTRVLLAWLGGTPIDALEESLTRSGELWSLRCANPACESDFLLGPGVRAVVEEQFEDDSRDLLVPKACVPELYEHAYQQGWSTAPDQPDAWLCEVCTQSHFPPSGRERRWLQECLRRAGVLAQ